MKSPLLVRSSSLLFALALGLPACGETASNNTDTGIDAGHDVGVFIDNGIVDSGPSDTGVVDTGSADAGTDSGARDAAASDASTFFAFGPCQQASDYQLGNSVGVSQLPLRVYQPACLKVVPGTGFTIAASSTHPLAAGQGGAQPSIFPASAQAATSEVQRTAPLTSGFYPFYCTAHGSAAGNQGEMAGVIWVQ